MLLKNVREQKQSLRAKHKKLRSAYPPKKKAELDTMLAEKFFETEEYKSCDTLFAFVSSAIEVDTSVIISRALADGKCLALPRCRNRYGEMDFYFVSSISQLVRGEFSLMEPDPKKCVQVKDLSSGLCIVPGLCFDFSGYRVGFGKGYYDRFLQNFGGITAGLCYSRCVEHEIPRGKFDKPVDILITEKYINHIQ